MTAIPRVWSILALALWLGGFTLFAQDPAVSGAGEAVTEITSKQLVFDYAEKLAVFTGDVVVTDPDMQLSSDVLRVFLTADDEIKRIEAEGNVVIKMEGLHSQSGRADYVPSTGVLVLTKEPQVSRENSIMQAVKFTYYQMDDRLEADGQVRLLNFQGPGRDGDDRP
jgi:lipopolysaccharide transport protein LptA